MRKFLIAALLVLAIPALASATTVPNAVDPSAGPELWLTEVYNNSGGALDVGDVVVWDISSSTGDNDNYVTTTTTADTGLVAGVVYPAAIADGATGSIVVRGPVQVDTVDTAGASLNGPLCTSTTAGSAYDCVNLDQRGAFGHVTKVNSASCTGCVEAYVNP